MQTYGDWERHCFLSVCEEASRRPNVPGEWKGFSGTWCIQRHGSKNEHIKLGKQHNVMWIYVLLPAFFDA